MKTKNNTSYNYLKQFILNVILKMYYVNGHILFPVFIQQLYMNIMIRIVLQMYTFYKQTMNNEVYVVK